MMKPYVADWRNKEAYPPDTCPDRNLIAWEFLRRNAEYAASVEDMMKLVELKAFDRRITKKYKRKAGITLDGLVCSPSAKAGATPDEYFDQHPQGFIDIAWRTFANAWGLRYPVDPATEYGPTSVQFAVSRLATKTPKGGKARAYKVFVYPNEIAVRFRVDVPLSEQIEEANRVLKAAHAAATRDAPATEKIAFDHSMSETALPQNLSYLLRCFDAARGIDVPHKGNGKSLRLRAGRKELAKLFADEAPHKRITENSVKSWTDSAKRWIDDRKFILLVRSSRSNQGRGAGYLPMGIGD